MTTLNKLEATQKWVTEWNKYPLWLIETAIGDECVWYNITPIEDEDELVNYFPMWSTLFELPDQSDARWILDNLDKVKECGIEIYQYDDGENEKTFLGINGGGYDFYEEHWIPLYEQRGLQWHK